MKKRFLSLFLALMVACSTPFQLPVMAEEEATTEEEQITIEEEETTTEETTTEEEETTTEEEQELSYSDNRSDYSKLSDASFANFRSVSTSGMGKNVLYRSSSPIDPSHKRNSYADAALKSAKVTVVMNLSDSKATAEAYSGYVNTYYAKTKKVYMNMDSDYTSEAFRNKLGRGLRYFANYHGIYAIHCDDGIETTGFVVAVLECFMGATAKQVVSDYMTSYYNYYGISTGHAQYDSLAGNLVTQLTTALGLEEDFYSANLKTAARAYLKVAGLTETELNTLSKNLKGENHTQVVRNKKAATYKAAGYTGDTYCSDCGKLLKRGSSIAKLASKKQTIKVSKKASKTVVIKYKSIRRKSTSFKIKAKAKGKITYKVIRGKKKYITVSKSGKVTIKKRAKKGTYKIRVTAAATSDGKYKKATKIIKIKVK